MTTAPSGEPNDLAAVRRQVDELRREFGAFGTRLQEIEDIVEHYFDVRAQESVTPKIPQINIPRKPAAAAEPDQIFPPILGESDLEIPPLAEPVKRTYPVHDLAASKAADEARRRRKAAQPERLPDRVRDFVDRQTDAIPQAMHELGNKLGKRLANPNAVDWEAIIGGRWMTWAGAFTLLLAVGFGVHWAWSTFQTPPWVHVLAIHALGVGFLVGAFLTRRRGLPATTQALVGLGVFTLYAAAFAALHLYQLWPERTAFFECAALTVLAIGLALYADSVAVVLLGALGGYLTPILTSSGSGNYVGLFSYLAFLNIALVSCAVWRDWRFLKPLTLAATAIMFAAWLANSHFNPMDNQMVWGTLWFAVLHASIFLVGCTVPPLAWKRVSNGSDLLTLGANSLLFIAITWLLFRAHPEQQLALVSWGMSLLHGVLFGLTYARLTNSDRMPRVHLALAAVFFTLAIPLQINNAAFWGATWCLEGFALTAVGVYFRDRQLCTTATVVFLLGAARLLGWDMLSPANAIAGTALDRRAFMFSVAGLMMLVGGGLYRLIPWAQGIEEEKTQRGDATLYQQMALIASLAGALLVTIAPVLQLDRNIYLGPVWVVEALAFTALGIVLWSRQLAAIGAVVFALAGLRLLGFEFIDLPLIGQRSIEGFQARSQLIPGTHLDLRFVLIGISSIVVMLAGRLYWSIPRLLGRGQPEESERALGSALIGAGNIALMLGMLCQWDSRWVLVLWTLDVAIVWLAGFWFDVREVRWYAVGLALVMVLGRALADGTSLSEPYVLLANSRFASLALVAALFFAAGGMYRKKLGKNWKLRDQLSGMIDGAAGEFNEAVLDPLLGILANVVLLTAISLEIHSWYASAVALGSRPFPDMRMAEMATYSIVWAIYAALMVAAGFVLRYPLFRLLGLAAFGPILLKVFFLDLENLRWLPRVLALAVLGLMLMGVSMLYQKFAARMRDAEAEPQPE